MDSRFLRRTALALLLGAPVALANVSLPRVFGDHLVLQRDRAVPIWGTAAPQERVAIRFADTEVRTQADDHGQWHATLPACPASAEPRELTVSGSNLITLHDVLVGEVWLCAGQSNMEMAVGVVTAGAQPESAHDPALAAAIKTAVHPTIRLLRVEKKLQPPDIVTTGWAECRGEALARFSAAGYFFALELQRELGGVPVGLIESAWGGTRIEEWTPASAYAALEPILGADAERCFERDPKIVARNYHAMIAPLAPSAIRGVLWYQGESNLIAYNDGPRYADKFAALVRSWRAVWQQPDLPFYTVQLAPFAYQARKDKLPHTDDELPKLWDAQARAAETIPHVGLVPIADTVDNVHNIHPGHKAIVGRRLAAAALHDTYGRRELVAAGPSFAGLSRTTDPMGGRVVEGRCVVQFDHAEGGLVTSDGAPPTGFEVAGEDGRFVPATAQIIHDRVAVSAPEVSHPLAVRFGWHETAQPNLRNTAGWPAYPFCSALPATTAASSGPAGTTSP